MATCQGPPSVPSPRPVLDSLRRTERPQPRPPTSLPALSQQHEQAPEAVYRPCFSYERGLCLLSLQRNQPSVLKGHGWKAKREPRNTV